MSRKNKNHCTAILLWEITTELKDNKCTNTILSQNFRAPVLTDHFPEGFCFQVVGFGQMTFVSLKGFPA